MIKQNTYMMDIYGSSPPNMYDYQPIFDFDDNLMDNTDQLPSIQSDVEKVKTDDFYDDCLGDVFGNCMEDDDVICFKKDLQFVDCMWSATASCSKNGGVSNNNSNNCNGNGGNGSNNNSTQIASAASSYSESGALPPAIVTGTTLITDTEAALAAALRLVSSNSSNSSSSTSSCSSSSSSSSSSTTTPPIVIKQEPLDPFDISSSNNNQQQQQQQQRRKYNNSYDKENKRNGSGHINGGSNVKFTDIPPGGSLLRKSCQKSPTTSRNNNNNNNSNATKCTRPDTPFSPHDEISTCIKGSNNISLSAALSASDFIDHLSRELQNTTKKRISLPFQLTQGGGDINEVLDVLDELSSQQQDTIMTTPTTITTTTNGSSSGIGCSLSLAIDDSGCSSSNSVNMTSPPATSSDCDSDGGDCSMGENSSCSREFSTSSSMRYKNLRHHISDHSYTRCNEMADEHPPLETPSDSDEEIDVVTLTDKKLPTNPSDRDLGALQYQVAHKMIWNGSKKFSHPCYEFSTPASISPVKSVANLSSASSSSSSSSSTSSYSPKNAYNFSNDDYDFGQSSLTSALKMPTAASVTSATMGKGRKRYFVNLTEANSDEVRPKLKPTLSSSSSASSTTSTPMINKRCRSKKFAASNATNRNNNVSPSNMDMVFPTLGGAATGAGGVSSSSSNSGSTTPTPAMLKRQYSLDEADTIEKRNQHNDMERQRRIGLKNLFEALKKQIPTIRDKERAPKVNILREAAKLCQQLTEDEHTLEKQLQKLREKQRAHQELLHRLRSMKTE